MTIVVLALIVGCLIGCFLARAKAEYQAARWRIWDRIPDDVKDELALKHLPIAVRRIKMRMDELIEQAKAQGLL